MNLKAFATSSSLLLLFLAAGCQAGKEGRQVAKEDDQFLPEDDTRSYRRWADAQAVAGARADATLYAYHFDGDALNSLGQQKLSLMLKSNEHAWPLVVYVNGHDEKRADARQAAVRAYLAESGMLASQFRLENGPNPNYTAPAAPAIERYRKTEDVAPTGSGGPTGQAQGAFPPAAAGDGK